MYNESYEEYMRSILGYPAQNCNTYNMNNNFQYQVAQDTSQELEECYPKIYRIIYPMVCKACENNVQPVTKQLIDSLTNEIYMAVEGNEEVNININLGNDVRSTQNTNTPKKPEVKVENRSTTESRQIGGRNFLLNDLIRILLIRELLGGGNNQRPPFRPPMRPNFPGGMGPNRPPFRPRDFQDNYDIYEY